MCENPELHLDGFDGRESGADLGTMNLLGEGRLEGEGAIPAKISWQFVQFINTT
jgi:hypothetical protein